jgi:hypothetical protein
VEHWSKGLEREKELPVQSNLHPLLVNVTFLSDGMFEFF